MAKVPFIADIDLQLNQLLSARVENLTTAQRPAATAAMNGRMIYNTTTQTFQLVVNGAWVDIIISTDPRLTDSRNPLSHEIINASALGLLHSISGGVSGYVFKATGANSAQLMQLKHSELNDDEAAKHRLIDDNSISATSLYSSQKIESLIVGSLVFKGGYDAATNSPMLDATPIAGIKQGWTYVVTVAGTFYSTAVQVGDMVIAKQDTPTSEAHWTVVNKNIPDIVSATETAEGIAEIATTAEVTAGTDDSRIVTPLKLKQALGTTGSLSLAKKYTTTVGDGAALTYAITHNLNSTSVLVGIHRTASPYDQVQCEIVKTSANVVTLNFNVAPTSGQYTVTVVG